VRASLPILAAPILAALLIGAAPAPRTAPGRIFIASDSTAQDYKPDRYPQSGWGTMLRCALDPSVTVENRAIGGRSTRSFMEQGRLDAIARDIRPGDTLLIQFGHNDADLKKMAERFTPIPDYVANLSRFVAVAREHGAQAVILTPVTRRAFRDGAVPRSFPLYEDAARQVASAERVPLIDLAARSRAWVARAGEERSRAYYLHLTPADRAPGFPNGADDDVHFSELGARGVAELVAADLRRLGLPVSRHVLPRRPALARTAPAGGPSCAA